MKRKKAWFKSPIHIMAPLLVASVMIMGTVAYFTDVEAVVNTIRFGQISIETNETVSGLTKNNIGVTAQGNADCFVRIRVDVPTVSYTYIGEDGTEYTAQAMIKLPEVEEPISASEWLTYNTPISVTENGKKYTWYKDTSGDGFWYLDTTLSTQEVGQKTALFIKSITYEDLYRDNELVGGITEDMLTIPIMSEAVQADNIVDDIKDNPNYQSGAKLAMEAFDRVAGKENADSNQ